MNFFSRIILGFAFSITSLYAIAQDKGSVSDLVKQGVQLNDQGNYTGAMEKYNEALKIDPENTQANYEMAFSLYASRKEAEGIPYIEKAIKNSSSPALTAASYDLLGTIYDVGHKSDKAIEAYKNGINAKPDYQRLHFNLGITYFRNKQYAEAEASAIEAIKLDPKHASSHRLYALVTFHQDKRVPALMAFCNFLLLEPGTQRSAEAYGNIQHILQGGVLKDANGNTTILVSPKSNPENGALNLAISMVVASAKNKKLDAQAQLEDELSGIFKIAGEQTEKKSDKSFFDKFYTGYFYQLAKTNNVPAFARLISLSANNEANTKWMADNANAVNELNHWIETTPRSF